jgi:malate synthase
MKLQANNRNMVFPDRKLLTMDQPFLTQYMQRIVQVSHSRGVHAMGGIGNKQPELVTSLMKIKLLSSN